MKEKILENHCFFIYNNTWFYTFKKVYCSEIGKHSLLESYQTDIYDDKLLWKGLV